MASERTLFYKILLAKSGSVKFEVVLGTESAEDEKHQLTASDLLVVSPKHVYKFTEISEDFEAECVFVDEEISNDLVYHLSDDKLKAALDIIHMIRDIVRHQHIYKVEMIQSMFNVLRLILEELPYEERSISHDFKHKAGNYETWTGMNTDPNWTRYEN